MTSEGPFQGPQGPARRCWSCGSDNPAHYNFCSRCGAPLAVPPYQPPKPVTLRDIGRILGAYSMLPLLILMAVNVAITIWGIGLVYPHMDMTMSLFIVTPRIVPILELGGLSFFLYYVFLALAIAISFVWMAWKTALPIQKELMGKSVKEHSPLFTIATLFMAVLAFNIIFYVIISSSGTTPTSPDLGSSSLWGLIYGFANASVWEEVVTRILLIGVPLLFIDLFRRSTSSSVRERKLHQYILGGGFGIGKVEAALLLFSSIMFGIAHVWNWDLWKIVPSFVAGLALGYLFLKLGVYASILLHFSFDFLSIPLNVWPGSLALQLGLGLMSMLWVSVGMVFLLYYLAKALGWMTGRRIWPDAPFRTRTANATTYSAYRPPSGGGQVAYPQTRPSPGPQYQAPPISAPPSDLTAFGYRCRHCGNTEAHYEGGELICTRCRKT